MDRHDEVARREVERFRGRLVKSTGDGVLATFDAPTRALRCAFALTDALSDVGLEIRSAIHTGEIEIRDDDVGGIGVHIAARALAQAADREVVVTPNRPGSRYGHRPRLRLARLGEPSGRPRRVEALQGVGRVNARTERLLEVDRRSTHPNRP